MLSCLVVAQARAADADFAQRCAALSIQARVTVDFEARPITRDNTRRRQQLRNLSQSGGAANHSVYGLTYAQARMA